MKRAGLILLSCFVVFSLSAHNGTPTSQRAHNPAANEAPTPADALAPAAPEAAQNTFEATAATPVATAPAAKQYRRSERGVSMRSATERLSREERLAERRARKLERFEKKADKVAMNSTTSVIVGILVALAVVLAFAIDSTFGLVLLFLAALVLLFILLR